MFFGSSSKSSWSFPLTIYATNTINDAFYSRREEIWANPLKTATANIVYTVTRAYGSRQVLEYIIRNAITRITLGNALWLFYFVHNCFLLFQRGFCFRISLRGAWLYATTGFRTAFIFHFVFQFYLPFTIVRSLCILFGRIDYTTVIAVGRYTTIYDQYKII